MTLISRFNQFLFGYDFFISYSRSDGSVFALALARALAEKGFTCYLDQWGSEANVKVPKSLIRTLLNSKMMILLSTEASRYSEHVLEEIRQFSTTKRGIIPISTLVDHGGAIWKHAVTGIAVTQVSVSEVANGVVDEGRVINRIANAFTYSKQKVRISRMAWGLAALLVLVPIGSGITFYMMDQKIRDKNRDLSLVNSRFIESSRSLKVIADSLKDVRREITLGEIRLQELGTAMNRKSDSLRVANQDGKAIYDFSVILANRISDMYRAERNYYYSLPHQSISSDRQIVLFDFDSSVLRTSSYSVLDNVSRRLRESGKKMEILGLASVFGIGVPDGDGEVKRYKWGDLTFHISPSKYLEKLSKDRANAVKVYLVNSGVDAAKLIPKGYGEQRPTGTLGFFTDRVELVFL